MKIIQVGNLTITPNLNNPIKDVHPAIGVVDETAYVGVWLPCQIQDEKGNAEHKKMLFLVTDKNEIILANNNTFRDNGKDWRLAYKPIEFDNRWNLAHVNKYLQGATVDPIEAFDELYSIWKKFIDFTSETEYLYQTIWVMGTYFHPFFNSYPYSYFGGIKGAGKTKTLKVNQKTAFNAVLSSNMSTSSIYRLIQNARSTLLIDETEKLSFKGNISERTEEFRSIILSGYKKGAVVYRIEKNTKDRLVPTAFEIFSPKCLANIRGLEDVMEDRCKPTIIKKSKNKEIINRAVDSEKEEKWKAIRNKLYLFYLIYWKQIKDIYEEINNLDDIQKIFNACSERCEHKSQKCDLDGIELVVGRQLELWKPIITFSIFWDRVGLCKRSSQRSLNSLSNIKNEENDCTCSLQRSLRSQQCSLFLTFEMIKYAIEDAKQRKTENATETGESILVQVLLKMVADDDYYSISQMKSEMELRFDEEQKWITSRWIGAALKRLGFKEKRRSGKGYEYRLTTKDILDLALRMEIDVEKEPQKTESEKMEALKNWIKSKTGMITSDDLKEKISELGFIDDPETIIQRLIDAGDLRPDNYIENLGGS